MMMIARLVRSLLLFTLTVLLILGCSRTIPHMPQQKPLLAACRRIEHDAGSTELCNQPHTIAVLSPYLLDILLSLGEQPAAYASTSLIRDKLDRPEDQIPYLGDRVMTQPINLGDRSRPSLEALALLKPDLILGELWQGSQGQYELFSQIAPTILLDDQQGGWQRSLQQVAEAIGRSENLQQVMDAREQRISEARQKLTAVVKMHPRILLLSSGDLASGFYAFGQERSVYSDLLEALGFQIVRLNEALLRTIGTAPLSLEILPELETDILIVLGWDKNNDLNSHAWQQLQHEWNQIPVLKTMAVSQAARVYFMDAHLTMLRGALAEAQILNDLLQRLAPSS
jgi:iron complex transport system substrate-binding protein